MITVGGSAYIEYMQDFKQRLSIGDILVYVSGPNGPIYIKGQIVGNLKCIKVVTSVGNTYYVHRDDDTNVRSCTWWKIRQRVFVFQCINE